MDAFPLLAGITVSTGTLKLDDLAVAFKDTFLRYAPEEHSRVEYWESRDDLDESELPIEVSDDLVWDVEELIEDLQTLAEDGYVFGAHPGDGACYGFWPTEIYA